MKATELQIGDWVGRVFDDKRIIEDYRQVDWIRTGEIGMRYCKVWSIGCIEPIPLTPEILKKNGFVFDCGFWTIANPRYNNVRMVTYYSIGDDVADVFLGHWAFDENYAIDYVHELQHALRLCGLDELADNFKI